MLGNSTGKPVDHPKVSHMEDTYISGVMTSSTTLLLGRGVRLPPEQDKGEE